MQTILTLAHTPKGDSSRKLNVNDVFSGEGNQ